MALVLRSRWLEPRELGRRGESRAAWFYRLRGYTIAARNVRRDGGEIDLVVTRGRTVVFVEVKARQQERTGSPHEAVDHSKQLRLVRLATAFLRERKLGERQVRFDVVSLVWNGRHFELAYFPDAFRPVALPGRPWAWS
jgi:putative endonuclease